MTTRAEQDAELRRWARRGDKRPKSRPLADAPRIADQLRRQFLDLAGKRGDRDVMVVALDLIERARRPVDAAAVFTILVEGLAGVDRCDAAVGTLADEHELIRVKPRVRRQ